MREIYPGKKINRYSHVFYGASNVQLGGKLLKVHYPKLTVMRGVEHTVNILLWCFKDTHCKSNDFFPQDDI